MKFLVWEITYVGFTKNNEWQRLATLPNHKIAAIKEYRRIYKKGLKECKEKVESYMVKMGIEL